MITVFPEPCWAFVAAPEGSFEPHHPTREEAVAEHGDSNGVIYLRPELCRRITCDGCGTVRTSHDVEGYEYTHHRYPADAETAQRELGPLCEDCEQAAALGSVATADGGVRGG